MQSSKVMEIVLAMLSAILTHPDVQNVIAGSIGGAVRARVFGESWRDTSVSVFAGGSTAYYAAPYLSPVVARMLGGDVAAPSSLASYAIGVGGVAIIMAIVDGWKSWHRRRSNQEHET